MFGKKTDQPFGSNTGDELGAEGYVSLPDESGKSAIRTSVPVKRASIAAFSASLPPDNLEATAHYELDDLGIHATLPPDFSPSSGRRTSKEQSGFPDGVDPYSLWNHDKR